jgi:hypothetical protein
MVGMLDITICLMMEKRKREDRDPSPFIMANPMHEKKWGS